MSSLRSDGDQERLIDYVRQALAKIDAGEPVLPTVLCREHPQLARPLAEVLGLADELPLLQQVALREDPLAGVVLAGRYRLATCLGRGAMGVVYRGEDQELRRDVAVKILDARLFRDPEAERRFAREGEALAALQHGNVVAVHDRGRTPEGIHFLVMELLDGATLAAVIERIAAGASPEVAYHAAFGAGMPEAHWPRQCAAWARDLAHGLAAAHSRQLVHRDVKPSNVFVTRQGRPVLLDFGIAARDSDQRLTATRTTLGTPWYMAPEQVQAGSRDLVAPTLDVYGLGATLYHLLAGALPYVGDAAEVLTALPVRDPIPLSRARPGLPRDLVAIVEKCMERAPARRYAGAEALAADLDAFLRHQPVAARPISALGRRLRAWRRAPARPVAVVAVVVAVVAGSLVAWNDVQQRTRLLREQKTALERTMPSHLAVEGYPEQRVLAVLHSEHDGGIEFLDRLLELDPDDTAARWMRACLHLDLGQAEPAMADVRRLSGDSPYLAALAARYAAAVPDERGVRTVRLDGLPEPVTPEECFVAGFHELRNSDVAGAAARADALFVRAGPNHLAARNQRLFSLAALADAASPADQPALAKTLYDETVALEVVHGGPTARTCAMRGVALLLQRRDRESIAEFERSLQLRPGRHGPLQNLGIAYKRLNDFERSARYLQEALAVRPFAWNTRFTLAQVLRELGKFEEANAIAASLSRTGVRGEAWMVPDLIGSIAAAEMMARLVHAQEAEAAGDAGGYEEFMALMRESAALAVAAYDEALAVRASAAGQLRREFAAACLGSSLEASLVPFLRALGNDPTNAYQLANLAFLLPPSGLDAERTAWLKALLRRLAKKLAPGNEAFGARMDAEADQDTARWR